jgi:hypothetical protein
MNDAIIDTVNEAIREWNGQVLEKGRKYANSNADVYYEKCMHICRKKSDKGFFSSDRQNCFDGCSIGKTAFQRGDDIAGKIAMCRGICEGIEKYNGAFFGFGASSYDKCVDNCVDQFFKYFK